MNLVNPNKNVKWRQIERVVFTPSIDRVLSIVARNPLESGGFLYGMRKKESVYLARFLHNPMIATPMERKSQIRLSYEGEESREFIKKHNQIVKRGKETIEDFVCVPYHGHPRVNVELLTEEERRINHIKENAHYAPIHDNSILSPDDIEFARNFGTYSLSCIAVGTSGDPSERKGMQIFYDFARSVTQLVTRRKNNRVYAYQVFAGKESHKVETEVLDYDSSSLIVEPILEFIDKTEFIGESSIDLLKSSYTSSQAIEALKGLTRALQLSGSERKFS